MMVKKSVMNIKYIIFISFIFLINKSNLFLREKKKKENNNNEL